MQTVSPDHFLNILKQNGIEYFAGVPDSLLKSLCAYMEHAIPSDRYRITPNEGSAAAAGIGYYLASGRIPGLFLQNSGIGHLLNPLLSLADPKVYGFPSLSIIGWRGELAPNGQPVKDEPQHRQQGEVTLNLLESCGIPYRVLPDGGEADSVVSDIVRQAETRGGPAALVIRKEYFTASNLPEPARPESLYTISREEAIEAAVDGLGNAVIFATTGMTGRELFAIRRRRGEGHRSDFLSVGGMGHAVMIACEAAASLPDRAVCCFDGDGALIMHTGNLAFAGTRGGANLKHIVFNNGAHDSVGGQPTAGFAIDIPAIARGCGYRWALSICKHSELTDSIRALKNTEGPALLEIRVKKGNRPNPGRPDIAPAQAKASLMQYLRED